MAGRWLIVGVVALMVTTGSAFLYGIATSSTPGPAAPLSTLREKGVIYLADQHVYLVFNAGHPLALSDDPQHLEGEHTQWCSSSKMFETPTHGEKFDRRGYYYGGPARSGLDRFPVRLDGNAVYVDLDRIIEGPARGTHRTVGPQGPLCYPD